MGRAPLAVVGAGNMGSGIAQKMAMEGFPVVLLDLNAEALERGLASLRKTLEEAVARRIVAADQLPVLLERIRATTDWSALASAELVVEAVFENLDVKRDVFRHLSAACPAETLLATNTSSFSVRDLAAVVERPERVLGLHYFYHPAKNRLVEVVPAGATAPATVARAWSLQESLGKTPIACADAPGFVVNRYFVPWLNEAVRLLEEGQGNLATIEAAARKAFGIGMGPFELMNVTGVPIALHAARTLGRELGEMYAPARLLEEQFEKKAPWDLSGDVDESRFPALEKRLLGIVFLVAAELVEQGVGSVEDTDIGARVGLRWTRGPFELMNRRGVREAASWAGELAARHARPVPALFARQAATGSPFSFRLVEVEKQGEVATLLLNRPDALNAINQEVVRQLAARFAEVEEDPAIRVVVLAGKGKAFIAGADIRFFVRSIEARDLDAIQKFTEEGHALLRRLARSPKIVVARLDGLSLGGGSEIALACDYILATEKGSLGFPETGIGIYPGLGGTQRLPRRVGVPLARWLILSGAPVDARTALQMGLVDACVAREELARALAELARRGKPARDTVPAAAAAPEFRALEELYSRELGELLATPPESQSDPRASRSLKALGTKAPVALRLADNLLWSSAHLSLDDGLAAELQNLREIFATEDAYQGLSTLGKAKPVFHGR